VNPSAQERFGVEPDTLSTLPT